MLDTFSMTRCLNLRYRYRRRGHDEWQTGPEGAGTAPAACGGVAQRRHGAGRGGPCVRGQPQRGEPVGEGAQRGWQARAAVQGAGAPGAIECGAVCGSHSSAQARVAGRGVCHRALELGARGRVDRAALWAAVFAHPGVADSGEARLELPAPGGARHRARRAGDPTLETAALADAKKTLPKSAA